jgi:hypothetical protein
MLASKCFSNTPLLYGVGLEKLAFARSEMASYSLASSSILIDRGLRLTALRGVGSVRFVLLIRFSLKMNLTPHSPKRSTGKVNKI